MNLRMDAPCHEVSGGHEGRISAADCCIGQVAQSVGAVRDSRQGSRGEIKMTSTKCGEYVDAVGKKLASPDRKLSGRCAAEKQ